MPPQKDPIFTPGFCLLCFVNFTFFLALNMLLPVMPIYCLDVLNAGKPATGVLLSLYVIASLIIRPLAGHVVDSYPRKAVFLLCTACYTLTFSGYLWIDTLVLLGLLRAVHGMSFGMVNTAATTLLVDIIPPMRLGTGIGLFGITGAVTMAAGPMLGLLLYDYFSPQIMFYSAFAIAVTGAAAGLAVPSPGAPAPKTAPAEKAKKTFREKLFLKNAGMVGLCLSSTSFIFGLILNFISVFARERDISVSVGYFFGLLALGMVISRIFAGRIIDGGGLCKIILIGKVIFLISVLILTAAPFDFCFFLSALGFGLGMGVLFPAYQTMFIDLAPAEQRGVANSSLFIAWDGGVGIALFLGGSIAELTSFTALFLLGGAVIGLATLFFALSVRPHYEIHSLRRRRME